MFYHDMKKIRISREFADIFFYHTIELDEYEICLKHNYQTIHM